LEVYDIYEVKKQELYGSEMPETEEDLLQIKQQGIEVIISLDEGIREHPNYEEIQNDFEHHELFITDFDIPSDELIEQFLEILLSAKIDDKKVLVHCIAGCGRTGTMLALAERFIYDTLDGEEAIRHVREIRPCAIETQSQYNLVLNYKRSL
jgi:atypical dual specificity phosphatase